ncbi:MAG: hypothetical protein CM1200mP41_03520 [Gammaproteobacteria bacterium]|nr:MAG: hypothetical protein CM1200mP41_03520 [Gammaproteobacteria bacterium]
MSDHKTSFSDEEVNLQFREIPGSLYRSANDQSNRFNGKCQPFPCYMPLPVSTHSSWRGPADDGAAYDGTPTVPSITSPASTNACWKKNLDQYREMFGQQKYQHLMPDRPN